MTAENSTLATLHPFVSHRAFTLWRWEEHKTIPGARIKVPVHYDGATRHSSANPAPPLTAEEARAWQAHHANPAIGVGFRPEGTGLVCIDLDACIVDGQWSAGALEVMRRFPGALLEQSVSGTGLHVWVQAPTAPVGRRGQVQTPLGKLEMYANGQFLAAGTVLCGEVGDHTAAVVGMLAEFWPAGAAEPGPAPGLAEWAERPALERAAVLADVASALQVLDPDSRDEWVGVGQALQCLGEEGYALWAEWSARSGRFPGGDGLEKWDTFSGERSDYRAVLARAQRAGWVNPASRPNVTAQPAEAVFAAPAGAPGFGAGALPAGALTEPPAPAAGSALSFMAAAGGLIAPSVSTIQVALQSPEAGIRIAYDTFKDRISVAVGAGPWHPFRDTHYGKLRAEFEKRGFKAVPAEPMHTAVAMVAEDNQFDSLTQWAEGLTWDGVARIDRLMPDYYGAEDTPYARAVGAYAFTTLGGRAVQPGVKADMALIIVGLQGARKTSALQVLVPEQHMFGEVDLSKDEDVIARKLRGKSLIELAEMRGFKGRDADANKAWVSRQWEEWTPKYKEFTTVYHRRCLVVGTTNDEEQLDDPTGARRFLPIRVGAVNVEALERDRDQLWAEGIARFKSCGVAWQDAERLARAEHHKFEVVDERQALVEEFLAAVPPPVLNQPFPTEPRSAGPIRGIDILTGCYGMARGQIKKADEMALSKIMKRLGYSRALLRVGGHPTKVWIKGGGY